MKERMRKKQEGILIGCPNLSPIKAEFSTRNDPQKHGPREETGRDFKKEKMKKRRKKEKTWYPLQTFGKERKEKKEKKKPHRKATPFKTSRKKREKGHPVQTVG